MLQDLKGLAQGKSIIYIVSRVFDFYEKLKAEDLEDAVRRGVNRAFLLKEIIPIFKDYTFVPFRDTIQEAADDELATNNIYKTINIYQEDLDRLKKLFLAIGFLDGFSKDEGVCFELGYAFGLGKPIFLIASDFVRSAPKASPNIEYNFDPILEFMVSKSVYHYTISNNSKSFRENLKHSLDLLFKKVEDEVLELCINYDDIVTKQRSKVSSEDKYDVFLEFGGGLFEWQRELQEDLLVKLNTLGISACISTRFQEHISEFNKQSILEVGYKDLKKVLGSKIIVTCGDSPELIAGTAAIQGYARSLDKKIILYDSKLTYIVGDNGYQSSRNLMIDHSADISVSEHTKLIETIQTFLE